MCLSHSSLPGIQHAPKERCFGKQMSLDTDRRSMGWVGAEDMEAERKFQSWDFKNEADSSLRLGTDAVPKLLLP